jgi:hypothetical protein
VPLFHPSGYMDEAPRLTNRTRAKVPAAADGCKNIRLSADAA